MDKYSSPRSYENSTRSSWYPFPQNSWSDSQALLQELQTIDSAITNIPMTPQGELKSRHIESSNNMQQQVIVTDSTGATNSLIESAKSHLNEAKSCIVKAKVK